VIEALEEGSKRRFDVRVIDDPAEDRIDLAPHMEDDAKAVAV
jgi:hypothetical protein